MDSTPLEVVLVGSNATRLWGMTVDERTRRIAEAQHIPFRERPSGGTGTLLVNRGFVFAPEWLRYLANRPGQVLTLGGKVAIGHCRNGRETADVQAAMESDAPFAPHSTLAAVAHEEGGSHMNSELRKREQLFLMRLDPRSVRAAERASYFGAYKGVTDLLTKYLWPEWALVLTRLAARLGISPNAVTAVGAALCVLATILFWQGQYWSGMALGFVFMVLDTVDGKLARCTITSSRWGNVFDHGIDLIHPPFWWYAWGAGLAAYGRPIAPDLFTLLMILVIGGYVAQRLIEGAFMRLFRMHIHVWRHADSWFRLITARRNPNMVILFASMLFSRPDIGLAAIAAWTIFSCSFHFVRLLHALILRARGERIYSWLG